MGNTPTGSPKGGPLFNATPQTVSDLNALRTFAELIGNRKVGTTTQRNAATGTAVWPGLLWGDTTDGFEYIYSSGWIRLLTRPIIPWTAVTYTSGWANYGAGFTSTQFMVDAGGTAFVRGQILPRTGYSGTEAMFTLPVGARPTAGMDIPAINNGGASPALVSIGVATTGAVTLAPAGVPALALAFSFPTT